MEKSYLEEEAVEKNLHPTPSVADAETIAEVTAYWRNKKKRKTEIEEDERMKDTLEEEKSSEESKENKEKEV